MQQDKRMVIPFNKLPLQHAIKEVHGDGSRVMALFEDPFCPICRVFTKFVDQIDNVTIYRFIFLSLIGEVNLLHGWPGAHATVPACGKPSWTAHGRNCPSRATPMVW